MFYLIGHPLKSECVRPCGGVGLIESRCTRNPLTLVRVASNRALTWVMLGVLSPGSTTTITTFDRMHVFLSYLRLQRCICLLVFGQLPRWKRCVIVLVFCQLPHWQRCISVLVFCQLPHWQRSISVLVFCHSFHLRRFICLYFVCRIYLLK